MKVYHLTLQFISIFWQHVGYQRLSGGIWSPRRPLVREQKVRRIPPGHREILPTLNFLLIRVPGKVLTCRHRSSNFGTGYENWSVYLIVVTERLVYYGRYFHYDLEYTVNEMFDHTGKHTTDFAYD